MLLDLLEEILLDLLDEVELIELLLLLD